MGNKLLQYHNKIGILQGTYWHIYHVIILAWDINGVHIFMFKIFH